MCNMNICSASRMKIKPYCSQNSNFNKIQATELKLIHQQQTLAQNFDTFETNELGIARKKLYLELRSFKQQSLTNFLFDLEQILQNNHLDSIYEIVFTLSYDHQFCFGNLCYTLPIFNILDEDTIQIIVQFSLVKAVYISCTILANSRKSIFKTPVV